MNSAEKANLITYKLERAKTTLKEGELLLANKFYNAAINRIYYACFYAVSALLASRDIKSRKHSETIQLFGLHFVLPGIVSKESGKFYTEVFDMRQSGDYEDLLYFIEEDTTPLIAPAAELIAQIEKILSQ